MAILEKSNSVRIGILHSLEGPMALSESPLVDAAILSVEEINQSGGVLGRTVEAVIGNGGSNPDRFRKEAERLITVEGAAALFGCWTSACRKAVKPIVETHDSLLWYPIQYEGLEQSPNIVYTGACLNQQIEPFLNWCLAQGYRKFFLLGSDYVFPRTANMLVRSLLGQSAASVVGEEYFPLNCEDFTPLLEKLDTAKPDMIINTVNGFGNLSLFRQVFSDQHGALDYRIGSMSCSEIEYSAIGRTAHGHYACWGYFQSADTPENTAFTARYQSRFGKYRLVSDPIATAYSQILLWAKIANTEGSINPSNLKHKLTGQAVNSPMGRIEIQSNNHITRQAIVGRYDSDGFNILWKSPAPIDPLPWMGIELIDSPSRPLMINLLTRLPDDIVSRSRLEIEVNERKQAEQAVRDSGEQFRAMSEAVFEATIMIDSEDKIIFWNNAAERMFGYSSQEVLGKSMHQLITFEEEQQKAHIGIKEFAQTGRGPVIGSIMEFVAKHKDGTAIPIERSVASFKRGDRWYAVGIVRDIRERKTAEAELVRLATTDGLTGITNRRHFVELANKEIERAKRFGFSMCLVMFDVDHFKKINDNFGHDIGDEVLKRIALLANKSLRTIDIFARIGGEEFAIIMPQTDVAGALAASERLLNNFRADSIQSDKGKVGFTSSIGIALMGGQLTSVDSLLKAADSAMYRAKEGGRDRIEIFKDE